MPIESGNTVNRLPSTFNVVRYVKLHIESGSCIEEGAQIINKKVKEIKKLFKSQTGRELVLDQIKQTDTPGLNKRNRNIEKDRNLTAATKVIILEAIFLKKMLSFDNAIVFYIQVCFVSNYFFQRFSNLIWI